MIHRSGRRGEGAGRSFGWRRSVLVLAGSVLILSAPPAEAGLLGTLGKIIAAPVTLPMKLLRRGDDKDAEKKRQERKESAAPEDGFAAAGASLEGEPAGGPPAAFPPIKVVRSPALQAEGRGPRQAILIDRVVAKVGTQIITLSEVEEAAAEEIRQIWQESQGEGREKKLADIRRRFLEQLIEKKLQLGEALRIGIEVAEKDVERAMEEIKKENRLDDAALKTMLEQSGMTMQNYKDEVREQILVRKAYNFAVVSRVAIDDEEVRQYYTANATEFSIADEVQASHILLRLPEAASEAEANAARGRLEEIRRTLLNGADFAEVAKKVSEGPAADRGGDLGVFRRGQVLPEIEQHAFGQAAGTISEVFRTQLGFHLIKTEKLLVNRRTPLEFARDPIRNKLYGEKTTARFKEWVTKLREEVFVEVLM
ncbi:MAG: peptidylprolyl isomerase [Candidatus Tectomicrobia bacterium]|nr:peptidylprolyl isomerase [Candidatus Tectomicrobia bacterium]